MTYRGRLSTLLKSWPLPNSQKSELGGKYYVLSIVLSIQVFHVFCAACTTSSVPNFSKVAVYALFSKGFRTNFFSYLAASQCFHDSTDVLMLATNMIRKDLHSGNMYDTGVALGALACFVTADLARDLASDIVNLVSFYFFLRILKNKL